MKKYLLSLVQVVVSVLCLALALSFVRRGILDQVWASADLLMLLLAFLSMPPAILSRAYRWWYILRAGGVDVPMATMGKATFVGMALNVMLPGGIGDVARSYYGWAFAGNKEAMLASAVVDKIVGLFTLCVLGAICSLLAGFHRLFAVSTILGLPLFVVLVVPKVIPWRWFCHLLGKVLQRHFSSEELARTCRLDCCTFGGTVMISLIGWVFTIAIYYCACRAFTPDVSLAYICATAPLINFARAVPVAVSGLGSVDLLFIALLGKVGITESVSMMASLVVDMSVVVLPALIGAILLAACRTAPAGPSTDLSVDRYPVP